jgi:predicted dinucleotide-binding enzyme/predicted TIM-barrel fold metal-dependent hydrolase
MKIGVIGAGFIGRALARLAVQNGHEVMIANSRGPETLGSAAIALRCKTGTASEAARFGDAVVLAIPLKAYVDLNPRAFEGKVVLDANNYYPERDGRIPALDRREATTTGLIAAHLAGARLVKFFNAILQEDIEKDARPRGTPGRRALPIAGDDPQAKRIATELADQFGYDTVDAGSLADSWRFERAMPAYCVPLDAQSLREALAAAQRGVEVPHGSWRRTGAPPPEASATARASGSHKGGFSGRGALDIVDAQFHLSPEQDASSALAAMDALGIRGAILDELWGFDAQGQPIPHGRLPNGACRPLSPQALSASLLHPSRFSFLQRVVRDDPQLPQLIATLATTPGCRSLRASLITEDERVRFGNGEWDEILHLAQQHELPISVLAEDSGRLLARAARRFEGLQVIVDHCGWARTPQQWEEVLQLARLPNTWLKWSHAGKAFRRHDDPQQAPQREFLRAMDAFGPERVLWASDTSHEESSATWSELLAFVRDNTALSEGDRAWVLGRSARRVFRLEA